MSDAEYLAAVKDGLDAVILGAIEWDNADARKPRSADEVQHCRRAAVERVRELLPLVGDRLIALVRQYGHPNPLGWGAPLVQALHSVCGGQGPRPALGLLQDYYRYLNELAPVVSGPGAPTTVKADGPFLWYKYPYRNYPSALGSFHAAALPTSIPIPTHQATPADVERVERLGLHPRKPDWERLRGLLLRQGLRADDLPALTVSATLAVLTEDETPAGNGDCPDPQTDHGITEACQKLRPGLAAASDRVEAAQNLLGMCIFEALSLYYLAARPAANVERALEEYAGCKGDERPFARGLAANWKALADLDTAPWRDLRHWKFLDQTIRAFQEGKPETRGWRAAWGDIAERLRGLSPVTDPLEILADLRERAAVLRGTAPPLPAVEAPPAQGAGGTETGPVRPQKRRGRKPDTDPKQDQRIADAWQTGSYRTHAALANQLRSKPHDVKRALDRHRKRQNKRRKN